jgi:hypothetical protein
MAMFHWDVERLPEDLCSRFGNDIIGDVGIKYYSSYGDILNRPEFFLEIKEKFKIEKGYILTEDHNYKLMSLLRLYIDMHCASKHAHWDLYIKLGVADYRRENVENIEKIKKEVLDGYDKLHDEYIIDGNSPADSCYYQIRKYYIELNGVESPKNISLIIDW